ncbi:MAG: NAD(P)H-hydrate dehydratase, partial [Telluria sp.]
FIADKPGLHTCAGRDHSGKVTVARIGIDDALLPAASVHLNDPALFEFAFVPRAHDSHKGSFGDVTVIGGAHGMAGAPILAARAALYSGAGRVFVASIDQGPAYDAAQPELMFRDAASHNTAGSTVVAGPGMGDSANAMRVLAKVLEEDEPLVLDADALNLVAASLDLQARLSARTGPTIMTPHPLEAARLLGVTAGVVQGDRLAAAREIAARFDAYVVLKGSGSVIAMPDGEAAINPTGNPGLASAGTGDVLAGLCGSLLAQGWPARDAALAAVWMHGEAADRLVAQGVGPVGLTAGELPAAIRSVLNRMAGEA